MSVKTNVQIVPRIVLGTYFRAARLPLTVVERIAGQAQNEQWPPALAFEGFEANIEATVGSLLHDRALAEKGRVRQAKVAQLRKATDLETVAEQKREQADQTLEQRREKAEEQRAEAERRAEQREQDLKRQAELHEQKVKEKAAKKTAAARKTKAAQDKAVDRQERAAKAAALAKESEALQASKQALDAQDTVEVIDKTIEGSKAARQTG
jgi:hypothetical protein